MATIIDTRTSLDETVKIFDSFYADTLVVGSNQFDVVHSYFVGVCGNNNVAANFTSVLFRISQETGIDSMILLEQIQGTNNDKLKMNQILAYYMNSLKSKTSLYGISIIPKPVQPVARNIVQ